MVYTYLFKTSDRQALYSIIVKLLYSEAPKKCEGALKDRYCDQGCRLEDSAISCSCDYGYTLDSQPGKFGSYGACKPGQLYTTCRALTHLENISGSS